MPTLDEQYAKYIQESFLSGRSGPTQLLKSLVLHAALRLLSSTNMAWKIVRKTPTTSPDTFADLVAYPVSDPVAAAMTHSAGASQQSEYPQQLRQENGELLDLQQLEFFTRAFSHAELLAEMETFCATLYFPIEQLVRLGCPLVDLAQILAHVRADFSESGLLESHCIYSTSTTALYWHIAETQAEMRSKLLYLVSDWMRELSKNSRPQESTHLEISTENPFVISRSFFKLAAEFGPEFHQDLRSCLSWGLGNLVVSCVESTGSTDQKEKFFKDLFDVCCLIASPYKASTDADDGNDNFLFNLVSIWDSGDYPSATAGSHTLWNCFLYCMVTTPRREMNCDNFNAGLQICALLFHCIFEMKNDSSKMEWLLPIVDSQGLLAEFYIGLHAVEIQESEIAEPQALALHTALAYKSWPHFMSLCDILEQRKRRGTSCPIGYKSYEPGLGWQHTNGAWVRNRLPGFQIDTIVKITMATDPAGNTALHYALQTLWECLSAVSTMTQVTDKTDASTATENPIESACVKYINNISKLIEVCQTHTDNALQHENDLGQTPLVLLFLQYHKLLTRGRSDQSTPGSIPTFHFFIICRSQGVSAAFISLFSKLLQGLNTPFTRSDADLKVQLLLRALKDPALIAKVDIILSNRDISNVCKVLANFFKGLVTTMRFDPGYLVSAEFQEWLSLELQIMLPRLTLTLFMRELYDYWGATGARHHRGQAIMLYPLLEQALLQTGRIPRLFFQAVCAIFTTGQPSLKKGGHMAKILQSFGQQDASITLSIQDESIILSMLKKYPLFAQHYCFIEVLWMVCVPPSTPSAEQKVILKAFLNFSSETNRMGNDQSLFKMLNDPVGPATQETSFISTLARYVKSKAEHQHKLPLFSVTLLQHDLQDYNKTKSGSARADAATIQQAKTAIKDYFDHTDSNPQPLQDKLTQILERDWKKISVALQAIFERYAIVGDFVESVKRKAEDRKDIAFARKEQARERSHEKAHELVQEIRAQRGVFDGMGMESIWYGNKALQICQKLGRDPNQLIIFCQQFFELDKDLLEKFLLHGVDHLKTAILASEFGLEHRQEIIRKLLAICCAVAKPYESGAGSPPNLLRNLIPLPTDENNLRHEGYPQIWHITVDQVLQDLVITPRATRHCDNFNGGLQIRALLLDCVLCADLTPPWAQYYCNVIINALDSHGLLGEWFIGLHAVTVGIHRAENQILALHETISQGRWFSLFFLCGTLNSKARNPSRIFQEDAAAPLQMHEPGENWHFLRDEWWRNSDRDSTGNIGMNPLMVLRICEAEDSEGNPIIHRVLIDRKKCSFVFGSEQREHLFVAELKRYTQILQELVHIPFIVDKPVLRLRWTSEKIKILKRENKAGQNALALLLQLFQQEFTEIIAKHPNIFADEPRLCFETFQALLDQFLNEGLLNAGRFPSNLIDKSEASNYLVHALKDPACAQWLDETLYQGPNVESITMFILLVRQFFIEHICGRNPTRELQDKLPRFSLKLLIDELDEYDSVLGVAHHFKAIVQFLLPFLQAALKIKNLPTQFFQVVCHALLIHIHSENAWEGELAERLNRFARNRLDFPMPLEQTLPELSRDYCVAEVTWHALSGSDRQDEIIMHFFNFVDEAAAQQQDLILVRALQPDSATHGIKIENSLITSLATFIKAHPERIRKLPKFSAAVTGRAIPGLEIVQVVTAEAGGMELREISQEKSRAARGEGEERISTDPYGAEQGDLFAEGSESRSGAAVATMTTPASQLFIATREAGADGTVDASFENNKNL